MDLKLFFGIIASLLTIIGYYIYIKDIFYGKNRPHIFSWFIWGLITMIIYFIQITGNAGSGSWITLLSFLASFLIAIISFNKGTRNIVFSDIISLIFAFVTISLWLVIDNKIFSLILLILIDIFGYYPTFRKSIKNPFEENYMLYLLSIPKFGLSIFALNEITFITSGYLFANFFVLFLLVFIIVIGRKFSKKDI